MNELKMHVLIVVLHVLACLALILIVLLQTGRGAEMGAAFGGASQTLFGGGGGNAFMSKLTTGAAVVFMLTCLGLTYLSSAPQTKSIMQNVPAEQQQPPGPVIPEAKPVQPAPEPPTMPQNTPDTQEKPAAPESSEGSQAK